MTERDTTKIEDSLARIADSLEVIEDTLLFFKGEWIEYQDKYHSTTTEAHISFNEEQK